MTPAAHTPEAKPLLGIALLVIAVTEFAFLDAAARWLGGRVPLQLVLLVRYSTQMIFMAGALAWLGWRSGSLHGFKTQHPRFQLARGALLLFSSAMVFVAVRHMPLAEVTSISMLGPVLVTLLAASVLHEKVTRLQFLLVAVSFLGALVVVRPGSGIFGWVALLPLANAISYAFFNLLTGRLVKLESPYTTNFYTGLVGTGLMLLIGLLSGQAFVQPLLALQAQEAWVLAAAALLGTTGHLMLILAMQRTPTSTLMPFSYLQIPAAAGAGFLIFGHIPDGWAWLGMAIVATSGAVLVWLNLRRASNQAAVNAPPPT